MAGSYFHCVDDDGRLFDSQTLAGMLENGGDVYEAVEEMYGMIWYLADRLAGHVGVPTADLVGSARGQWKNGITVSPSGDNP